MTCPKCHAAVEERSNFCPRCGCDLRARRTFNGWIAAAAVCLLISAGVVLLLPPSDPDAWHAAEPSGRPPPRAIPDNAVDSQSIGPHAPSTVGKVIDPLPVGVTSIYDIADNLIAKIPTAVVANGWIALPSNLCLGGYTWQFALSNGDVFDIAGGVIGEQDDMGIWQLEQGSFVRGPRLSRWRPDRPLRWVSIVSESFVDGLTVVITGERRYTVNIAGASLPDEPGVITQDGDVVGWTFGPATKNGSLWNDLAEDNLVYDVSVYDYYRATFENGREEQLLLALAQKDAAPAWQLSALADAFILAPKLTDTATPKHLLRENIIALMHELIARLDRNEQSVEVADAFDAPRLAAAGDPTMVMAVVGAVLENYGFDAAMDLIEAVQSEPAGYDPNLPEKLEATRKKIYSRWLTSLIQDGDLQAAGPVYYRADTAFPQDPQIRLLGIELALVSGDWLSAERLLAMQAYPPELADKVALLKQQMAAARSEEGKTVIRFHPGARQIPVTVNLGGRVKQNFVIDTGATMVTIPRSAAEKLGIIDDRPSLRRHVQTAGGMVEAYEVVLPFIQMGNSRVENVGALVLDLPNQPNTGLLGMNYLNHFRMNINTESGILTLAPR